MKYFNFPSLVYCGYDYPADGIGNHLSLLDRLVFDSIPYTKKSLHALAAPIKNHPPYAGVRNFDHLDHPGDFKNSLYIDISRDMCDPHQVELSIQRAIAHKHAFNSVTALYLMWESDKLSRVLEKLPNAYDFVILTSTLLDKYLANKGVDVSHLPHPYDYTNITGAIPYTEKDRLVFGVSCGLWPRKNVALLASCFAETFGNDPHYILKIHTRFDPELSDFTAEYTKLSELLNCYQNIQLESVSLNRKDYIEWMRSLDVYCFISSGEGYSITPREALHLGIPVILLDAHVHHEFIHLPGVIRVSAQGKKSSVPNYHMGDPDQGDDWKVDERSLQEAFHSIAEHHKEIQQSLLDKHSKIVEFHDVNRIKQAWVNELNQQYITHLGSASHYLPKILFSDKNNYLIETKALKLDIQSQMKNPLTSNNTGEKTNKGVFCFPSRHLAGHCVFGQNVYPVENNKMQVRFYIELLCSQFGNESLVSLDVYDNISDKILVFQALNYIDFINSPDYVALNFNIAPEQRLEFRVFWHGHYDICVRSIELCETGFTPNDIF